VETAFFPEACHRFCRIIDRRRPHLLTGKVAEEWEAVALTMDRVERILRLSAAICS
jgi:hypothetical protein